MSVVQISRIQQRRGRKNTNYGFPQLASGELGWAIDTQELYIGNGAVSEGAPYVGNSKIITEHDDILQFVALYQYQKNNPVIQTGIVDVEPIKRSLQDRLDSFVSIKAFGVKGNGVDDDTVAFQRAIDQLFLNSATKDNTSSRVVLYMEPGEYIISDEIKIPPYTHIVGAGFDSTIIVQTGNHALFRTVDSNSTPGNYTAFSSMNYLKRPRNILISNLSLESTFFTIDTDVNYKPIVYLDNTETTLFDRVKFLGTYVNGVAIPNTSLQTAIEIRSTSSIFCSDNVLFNYCIFSNTGYGIHSTSDHNNISVENCVFYQLYQGVKIGGETTNGYKVITAVTDTVTLNNRLVVTSTFGMVIGMEVEFTAQSTVVTATATALNGVVTVSSVTNLHVGNTVFFTGLAFGGLHVNTPYFIKSITGVSRQITIADEYGPSATVVTTTVGTGSLSATVANTFGGIKAHGVKYYIKNILPNNTISLSLSSIGPGVAGATVDVYTATGNMTLSSVTYNSTGATNTKISNSYFDLIDQEGIYISKGFGNTSSNNKFMLVGNSNEGYANATYPNIKFDDENNSSANDYFERNRKLKDPSTFDGIPFISSIESYGLINDNNNFSQLIEHSATPVVLIRLPLFSSGEYIIDYVLNKKTDGISIRSGKITIPVYLDISSTIPNPSVATLNDNFTYTGSSTVEDITFSVELKSYKTDYTNDIPDTLVVYMFNTVSTVTMNYTYRMLSKSKL